MLVLSIQAQWLSAKYERFTRLEMVMFLIGLNDNLVMSLLKTNFLQNIEHFSQQKITIEMMRFFNILQVRKNSNALEAERVRKTS